MAKKAKKKKTEKRKRGFFAALFSPVDDLDDDELLDDELLDDELLDEELADEYYDDEYYDEELSDDEYDVSDLPEDEYADVELTDGTDEAEGIAEEAAYVSDGDDVPASEDAGDAFGRDTFPEDEGSEGGGLYEDEAAVEDEYADDGFATTENEAAYGDFAPTSGPEPETGADVLPDSEGSASAAPPVRDMPEDASAERDPLEPEEIVLFRPGGEDVPASTTRVFKTGSSTAIRIHLNETETLRAVDALRRKARAIKEKKQAESEEKRDTILGKIVSFVKRTAGGFLFAIAIFAALLAAGYYFFLLSDIRITGLNRTLSDAEIAQLTGLYRREHILFIDLDEVRETISANPYMQVNEIEYVFPARIRIDLSERTEAAAIAGLDYNVIIDENGYVLSMSSGSIANLIQITGISMSGFKLGQRIGESSDFTTASLISIIAKLKEYGLMGKIRSIDMTTPLAIVMYTYNGFKIHVGQPTDLDNKFSTLSRALPRAEAAHCYTGTLYLSAKGGAVYSPSGAEAAALDAASTDTNAIRLESGYEYGMYSAPDGDGTVTQGQSYSTSNGAQQQQQQPTEFIPDSPDDFQG